MSDQPDLFSRSESAENQLKAHAALYEARAEAQMPAAPAYVVAPARIVPQGGAALVRRERQRLMASQPRVVVPARERFRREPQPLTPTAVLRLKLADLPKLMQQRLEPPRGDGGR